jgi:hypothetical protein
MTVATMNLCIFKEAALNAISQFDVSSRQHHLFKTHPTMDKLSKKQALSLFI